MTVKKLQSSKFNLILDKV